MSFEEISLRLEAIKDKRRMSHVPYSNVIGSLMYAMVCTIIVEVLPLSLVVFYLYLKGFST